MPDPALPPLPAAGGFKPTLANLAGRASLDQLRDKTIAVLGYGAQGAAQAQNLRDAGLHVLVAQRPGPRHAAARERGFEPVSLADAARQADLLIFALPDDAAPALYKSEIEPHLRSGQALGFMHGFVIHYNLITPRPDLDVVLVAPKGQGQGVRDAYLAGGGVLALVAVAQDATGRALETALAWAAGLGSHRTAILQTTFRAETETDLFGEQAVLCGGVTALMTAAFETLTDAGYPPEMAYTECCHELKLIVDLIHAGGIEYMRRRISTTARFGDVSRGPRIIDEHVRRTLQEILNEVRDGRFAREFLTPSSAPRGAPGGSAALEQVGAYVRNLLLDKAR